MKTKVAILMGSDSDLPIMEESAKVFEQFGVDFDMKVLSAHRTPEKVQEYVTKAVQLGVEIFICGAGAAAHLAGVVAAHVTVPVIGVPLPGSSFNGMDALLATVQMPGGIAVATVGVGKSGAKNAALLAIQILSLQENSLKEKMIVFRQEQKQKIAQKNEALTEKYSGMFTHLKQIR